MKRLFISICILILFGLNANCQLTASDKPALEIPLQNTFSTNEISSYVKSHCASDSERIRALFVWIANNIDYDVEKVLLKKSYANPTTEDVLKTRKAVCQGYAELFYKLCYECNIKAILVPGYTKLPDGSIADLSHEWVAAQVNNKWFLFDPTWAAGSVKDGRFIRKFSNQFYKALPQEMIKDHMPLDPMYQFLNYPIFYNEFASGNTSLNTSKPFFNYADTIQLYNSLDNLSQLTSSVSRINRNGDKNHLIYEMLQVLNSNQHSGESKAGFDGAVVQLNNATRLFNLYIGYKNERFSSLKNNQDIQQLIDSSLLYIKTAYTMLTSVVGDSDNNKRALQNINSALLRLYHKVDDENIFLKTYFKTNQTLHK